MLKLEALELVQFRNYLSQKWVFSERIVGICGLNGTGKTNLLDAIYYLGFAKSYFSRTDAQNVRHGNVGMRINGNFILNNDQQEVTCVIRENNKKELTVNTELIKKITDHVGRFPCVMIAPDDVDLIAGSSESRRKMLDAILCQTNKTYLLQLIAYNKVLQQRNSLLKQGEQGAAIDQILLQILNKQLIQTGEYIHQSRTAFLADYIPEVIKLYTEIADDAEGLNLIYESQLNNQSFGILLIENYNKDLILQRTTKGIHRDDLRLELNHHPFRTEGSQGQRKSLLFALKLAEWEYLKKHMGISPILLLDDVFEKLDEKRMFHLMNTVCSSTFGQVFITDTHCNRLNSNLTKTGTSFQLLNL